jgi:acyl carrier protein
MDTTVSKPKKIRPELPMPYVAPVTATERLLSTIWSDLLDVDAVGVHDSFLELGGDSLVAARVVARVREVLPIDISAGRLLEATTVCIMAELIEHQVLNAAAPAHLDVLLGEIEALSDDEASRLLERRP